MIWAIVLAAGESKRMGEPKLLLPFGEATIIEKVIKAVVQSEVDETLVVLGSDQKKIEEKIKDFPIEITVNPHFSTGMLSSVQWGFQKVPEKTRAVVVVLGDQPSISTDVVNRIVDSFRKTGKGIVLPVFQKERGHPVLIDMKYREEVEKLNPDLGLRGVVYTHPEDILEVEVENSAILSDINDVEDYKKELKSKVGEIPE
jgi:molybdenum cofactor cytidylyltransferase